MRKLFYIISIIILTTTACSKVDFVISEDYEKAEITGVELYNKDMVRADQKATISSEEGTIVVTLKAGQDITNLKIAVTASTGTLINPSMSVGYQDFSTPKTYEIISPNQTVKKSWTITVQNP
jgi:hypothetical protein